jgi:hypothetical protein
LIEKGRCSKEIPDRNEKKNEKNGIPQPEANQRECVKRVKQQQQKNTSRERQNNSFLFVQSPIIAIEDLIKIIGYMMSEGGGWGFLFFSMVVRQKKDKERNINY